MSIYKFVTQDELDDLPDDPQIAFATLVNIAQRRYSEILGKLDPDERTQWQEIEDTRHSFMNIIVASAKRLEIEPFVSMEVPKLDNFDNSYHRQFQSDLDHFLTQLLLDNSIRGRRDSVSILPKSKDRIRSHLHQLRGCVEKSQISPSKQGSLLKRLDDFERELEKRRLSLLEVTKVTLAVLAIPGGVWASADVANKLISNVMRVVAEAKAAEDEMKQLSPTATPKALSPPRATPEAPQTSVRGFADDLDEDIPF